MNNIRVTSALITLLVPVCAFSLGMGTLKSTSFLNEKFTAEIPLTDLQGINISSIKVGLASPEDFERAGLDRNDDILSLLTFTIKNNTNNQPVIFIQSSDRLTAPYLELMIDLAWPNGQLFREYTVLLDPPDYNLKKAAHSLISKNGIKHNEFVVGAIPQSTYTHLVSPGSTQDSAKSTRGNTTYGPTLATDDIWQIAQRYSSTTTTLPQVILAIVGTNSNAFTQGNLNGLKTGAKLQIPSDEEINKIPSLLAKQEVDAHDAAWKNNKEIHHVILPPYIDAVQGETQFDIQALQQSSLMPTPFNHLLKRDDTLANSSVVEPTFAAMSYIPPIFSNQLFKSVMNSNIANLENQKLKTQLSELNLANANLQRSMLTQTNQLNYLKNQLADEKEQLTALKKQSGNDPFWSYFWLLVTLGSGGYLAYLLYYREEEEWINPDVNINESGSSSPTLDEADSESTVQANSESDHDSSNELVKTPNESIIIPPSQVIIDDEDNQIKPLELPVERLDTNAIMEDESQSNPDNLIEYDITPHIETPVKAIETQENPVEEVPEFDFSLDDDSDSVDLEPLSDSELDFPVEEPAEDTMETHLDLAKTYIAMNEVDEAITYLNTVIEKGSLEQTMEARALLESINKPN